MQSHPRYSRGLVWVSHSMEVVMRRSRLVLFTTLAAALASLPVAARTSPLLGPENDAAECPDIVAATDDAQVSRTSKPATAKRNTSPAASKAAPATRGNGTSPVRAPRWHRFLPGMFR